MSAEEDEMAAAIWLAREDRGLAADEQDMLEEWLAGSSHHRVAYLRLQTVWRRADRLAALHNPLAQYSAPVSWVKRAALPIAAVLLILCGAAYLLQHQPPAGREYATGTGQRQAVRLADGTEIELNTNTKLHASVTARSRIVTLETGEAYFSVVHDAARPFTVLAGNRRITDLGTKFSVFRNGEDVRVVVQEGQVRVELIGQPAAAAMVAQAGHEVISTGGGALMAPKADQEIADELGWRRGMLNFNQQTLAEAAEQFNRYNSRHIEVEGSARKIRIGGSFKADNVDVFVGLLHRGFGLSVSEQGDRILVSR